MGSFATITVTLLLVLGGGPRGVLEFGEAEPFVGGDGLAGLVAFAQVLAVALRGVGV